MFKIFYKLVMMFIVMTAIAGGSLKTVPILNISTNKKIQSTDIKDNNIEDITDTSENVNKNDVISDEKSSSGKIELDKNTQYNNVNKKSTVKSKAENSSDDANKETNAEPKSKGEGNNSNKQENTDSSLNEKSSNTSDHTVLEVKVPTIDYDRTTSIYMNDNLTLLRVEYYLNNKLTYYSVVEQFDTTTKSYIEKIYKCNLETNIDPLVRTDVYVNGELKESY